MLKYLMTGLLIVAVGAVIVAIILLSQDNPDAPTPATSAANLQTQTLPASLPPVPFDVAAANLDADAFEGLLQQAVTADRIINGGVPQARKQAAAAELCDDLVDRVSAAGYPDGFADQHIPADQYNTQSLKKGLTTIRNALRLYVDQCLEQEAYNDAAQAAMACYELGRRLFVQNTRLRARQYGLSLMRTGLGQMRLAENKAHERGAASDIELDQQLGVIDPWLASVRAIERAWQPKLQAIDTPKPNVGDVIRVAQQDKDLTFRVFATLRLGFARFEHGQPVNTKAIDKAIDQAAESNEPMVKQAAEAARTITADHFHSALR